MCIRDSPRVLADDVLLRNRDLRDAVLVARCVAIHHELVALFLAHILAREDESFGGRVVRHALEFAFVAETCVEDRAIDAFSLLALGELIDDPVAREQEETVVAERDALEVAAQALFPGVEAVSYTHLRAHETG